MNYFLNAQYLFRKIIFGGGNYILKYHFSFLPFPKKVIHYRFIHLQ